MQRVIRLVALLAIGYAAPLKAQLDFLDNVFGSVTDINANLLMGTSIGGDDVVTDKRDGLGLRGVGIEVSFGTGDLYRPDKQPNCEAATDYDYELKELQVETKEGEAPDTIRVFSVEEKEELTKEQRAQAKEREKSCKDKWALSSELGIGYSQLAGFRGRTIDLRGSVEELPATTLYTTLELGWLNPYLGIRAGLAQLKSFQAFYGDTLFKANASTYEVGVAPGFAVGNPNGDWAIFAELSLTYRNFDNVDWSDTNIETAPTPAELRNSLNLSTLTFAIGGQIGLGKKEE